MENKDNPYDKAYELARAITDSDVYLDYIAAKERIEKHPEYKEKIYNLRNRQMELNKLKLLGEEMAGDSVNEITLEFAKLNQINEIAEFFNAEGCFIQLFNDLQEIIHKAVAENLSE